MDIYWCILFVLLGMIVGSFLNVCIDRLPVGGSLVFPPSCCDKCNRRLSVKDLIPVFSYLLLRGRCRYCQAIIPRRILFVEIGSGTIFACLFWYYGLSPELAVALVYGCFFLVIGIIDLEHGLILNKLVYPAMVLAFLMAIFLNNLDNIPSIASAAGGCGLGFGLFLLIFLASRGGMGMGDIKLVALIGLIIGFPLVIVAILLSVIGGGLVALTLLLMKVKKGKQSVPFGPFLSLATMVTLLYGQNIYDWYISFF